MRLVKCDHHEIRLILLIFLSISACSNPEIVNPNDWEEQNLRGKVKRLVWEEYGSELTETTIVDFNKDGYISQIKRYKDGNLIRKEVMHLDTINRIETIHYSDSNDSLVKYKKYLYNNGKLNAIHQYVDSELQTKWLYEMDNKGRKLKEEIFLGDQVNRVITYNHSADGSMTSTEVKESNGSLVIKMTEKYDPVMGQLITEIHSFGVPGRSSTTLITANLDSFDNAVSQVAIKDGELISSTNYEYTFDSLNNWIAKYKTSQDTSSLEAKRVIEYY